MIPLPLIVAIVDSLLQVEVWVDARLNPRHYHPDHIGQTERVKVVFCFHGGKAFINIDGWIKGEPGVSIDDPGNAVYVLNRYIETHLIAMETR